MIGQWLSGSTGVGEYTASSWDFDTQFLLLAKQLGKQRFAARYDWFAQTVSWTYEPIPRPELTAKYLQVDSNYNWRLWLGENPRARENMLQVGVRYTFETTRR